MREIEISHSSILMYAVHLTDKMLAHNSALNLCPCLSIYLLGLYTQINKCREFCYANFSEVGRRYRISNILIFHRYPCNYDYIRVKISVTKTSAILIACTVYSIYLNCSISNAYQFCRMKK